MTEQSRSLLLILLILVSAPAHAAQMASYCTLKENRTALEITGQYTERRLPIASVSKIMTAWWALSAKGLDYRFPTRFHVTPVGPDLYDVFIEGSRDPYFGRESLHFALSELMRVNVKNVRNLYFDENFKFYVSVTADYIAMSHYTTSSPKPATVLAQLQSMKSLTNGWSQTLALARSRGIRFTEKPEFTLGNIAYRSRAEMESTAQTTTYTMRSATLTTLLKEMNRNSNNHAANQIFEHIGGASRFGRYVEAALDLEQDQIRFYNGSGDRIDFEDGSSAYNEASCAATLKVLRAMRRSLQSQGRDLQAVMAVAGLDGDSTVTRLYHNDFTSGSMVGKTGTINPNVTLAGLVHTRKGEVYFMYNVSTNASARDRNSARRMIRNKVTDLIRDLNGGDPMSYRAVRFISFDGSSIFEEEADLSAGTKP